MSNREYEVTITGSSLEKIRGTERLRYTNFAGMVQLDDIISDDGVKTALDITGYVECHVHNDKSDTPEYDK